MKNKLLVAFLLMVAACSAQVCAQVDTLRGRVPYFHYNYYDTNWCKSQENQGEMYIVSPKSNRINQLGVSLNDYNCGGALLCLYNSQAQEVAIRMDMDSANYISGIALGYNEIIHLDYSFSCYRPGLGIATVDTPQYKTEDYIFNIYDEGMELLFSDTVQTEDFRIDYYYEAGFEVRDSALERAFDIFYRTGQAGYESPAYIGLCRIDFDTIIHVPATFYIGVTSSTPIGTIQNDEDTVIVITALYEWNILGFTQPYVSHIPYETRRYRIAAQTNGEEILNWAEEECHYCIQTCLYPILALPCGEVTGLRCQAVGGAGTVALVEWDGGANNAVYEVSYGPQGTPPGGGTVTTVSQPRFLQSLDRNAHYDFYVRARCDLADTTWTDWSGPLHVHLATAGIDGAEHVEWSLTPNPAHGSATVRCEEGIRSVELLTVKGERIQYQEMAGERTCTLDLGALATGVYIVQVTTAQGTAARKLAVE